MAHRTIENAGTTCMGPEAKLRPCYQAPLHNSSLPVGYRAGNGSGIAALTSSSQGL